MKIIKSNKVFYKCFTCKKIKLPKFFYVGHTSKCKECRKIDYENNKSTRKIWKKNNQDKVRKYKRKEHLREARDIGKNSLW